MVPSEFRKALCITAGLITLLEALIWGASSVYVIGAYNCDWDLINVDKGVSVWSMLIVTYLMGGCRGWESAVSLGYEASFIPPSGAATSLQVWLWTNAILSVVWIPTCFLLIVAVLAEVSGRNGALLYFPWQALTAMLILYDLAGTIYHAGDIFRTMTPENYAEFTNGMTWEYLTGQPSSVDVVTWLPSLLVTLFFCRFLIIWFLNIYFFLSVYKVSSAVSVYKTKNLQVYNTENTKSWRDMFRDDQDPIVFQNQSQNFPANFQIEENADQSRNSDSSHYQQQPRVDPTHVAIQTKQDSPYIIYKIEESGVLSEEFNQNQRNNVFLNKTNLPQSPYQQRRNIGYVSRPLTPDSFNEHWQDIPPPMAEEIKIPPELNRVRPFSYTAGDQPQIIKVNISRSNSRAEYPPIPRPDYTIAERRAASLEYIPHRFKVPAPKRPAPQSFNYDQKSPTLSKKAPMPSKKPHSSSKNPLSTVDPIVVPRSKYISPQGPTSHTRQTSQKNDYNINKLY